ncbi:MAG: hypothetical protein ACRC1K_16610 [Planctomycetia bacterium]
MSKIVDSLWSLSAGEAPQAPFVCDDAARPMKVDVLESRSVPAGMVELVTDLFPGTANGAEGYIAEVNGFVYFGGEDDSSIGRELWKTDGTASGTTLVKDLFTTNGNGSYPYNLINANGTLYFTARDAASYGGQGLWKSDGTESGTVKLTGTMFRFVNDPAEMNGSIYFSGGAYGGNAASLGIELWKYDPTTSLTSLVADINPGSGSSFLRDLVNFDGVLLFGARNNPSIGNELWRSDGSASGTFLVKDLNPFFGNSYPNELTVVDGEVLFFASEGSTGTSLWKTDGTASGTAPLQSFNRISYNDALEANGFLYFGANDGSSIGRELWKSDGTASGTVLVADVNPSGDSYSEPTANIGGVVFFSANDGSSIGRELWKTDGTASGTVLVADINPGGNYLGSYPRGGANLNGTLLFVAGDDSVGRELFRLVDDDAAVEPFTFTADSPASGPAGTAIPLVATLTLTDLDGSETASIVVTGVPADATLSAGVKQMDGTWLLTGMDLGGIAGLSITPPTFGMFNLTFDVTVTEASNGATATASAMIAVDSTNPDPAVQPFTFTATSPVSGATNAALPLSVMLTLTDLDGSETGSIVVTGVPAAASLSAGTRQMDGSYTLTPAQLAGLTFTSPTAGTFPLTFTATVTEASSGAMSSQMAAISVTTTAPVIPPVERLASTPTLSVAPATGLEDASIPLAITAALTDTDGSETLAVRIANVPTGASFSAGTNLGGGVWSFTAAQLAGLRFTPPADANGAILLAVTAVSTESAGGATATTTPANLTVSVAPVNDAPRLATTSPSVVVRGIRFTASVDRLQTLAGFSEVDAVPLFRGIAITRTAGNGTWQWRSDGATRWINLPRVSSSRAFLLRFQASVRFVPRAGTSVDGASLSFKAWDQTAGRHARLFNVNSNTVGGTRSLSTATARLSLASLAATQGPGRAAAMAAALDEAANDKPKAAGLTAGAVDAVLSAD